MRRTPRSQPRPAVGRPSPSGRVGRVRRQIPWCTRAALALVVAMAGGCGEGDATDAAETLDAGVADASRPDPFDGAPTPDVEAVPPDARLDAAPGDAAPGDAAPTDAASTDAVAVDAAVVRCADGCPAIAACEAGLCACPGRLSAVRVDGAVRCARPRDAFDLQGHRGAAGEVPPGNTVPSFLRAIGVGADTLEGDLRLDGEGRVVLLHDPTVPAACRWTGADAEPDRRIATLSSRAVAQFDCHPDIDGVQSPPTLTTLLDLVRDTDLGLNLEFKVGGADNVDVVMEALLAYDADCDGCLGGRLMVQAFRVDDLQHAAGAFGHRGLAFETSLLAAQTPAQLTALAPTLQVYSPPFAAVTEAIVTHAHALGLRVIPWTVDAPAELERLRALGVDGVISNVPGAFVEALE